MKAILATVTSKNAMRPRALVESTAASHQPELAKDSVFSLRGLHADYGSKPALRGIDIDIREREVTAFIGPSGCGKSTLLRCLNRMNDLIPGFRVSGQVRFRGQDIYSKDVNPSLLRRQVGMVFQKPNPFPKSIFENVAYALRIQTHLARSEMRERVLWALEKAHLLAEVEDRLKDSGTSLSGGQQQRLCIARALAVRPDVLLMDEPCSALDPIATAKIEELVLQLQRDVTIVVVTHNMQQAARISNQTAFMYMGELIEYGPTAKIFENPEKEQTQDYITGRFG